MESSEGFIGSDGCHFVLMGRPGHDDCALSAGAVLEVYINGRFQPVRVVSGGYRGWYYVLADGRRGRFALGMQARLCSAPSVADVGRVSDEQRG